MTVNELLDILMREKQVYSPKQRTFMRYSDRAQKKNVVWYERRSSFWERVGRLSVEILFFSIQPLVL